MTKTMKDKERQDRFRTDSGIELERVYSTLQTDYADRLSEPGSFPFTRGIYPTMYRKRLWTMRQYAGFGTADETNKRFRYLLSQGTTGLSVAFDLPTQIGYDSDHPIAEGEVGKVGVAIDSLEDFERLFEGIRLESITTSMTINSTAAILLSMYVALARKQGASLDRISGTIQNDILKEYIARGTYIYPPAPSMRLVTDTMRWCALHLPKWNPISISGYHIREAGSTAAQELAFTLANGIAYVQAASKAGLNADEIGSRLSFFFNVHNNFFEEVAKFRAARRMWAVLMRDRFGAKNPASMTLRFHAQTAGSTLTAQQIDTNVVRVSLQALAAVLGGCQSLHTNGRDEALSLPTEESARLALRTQQVIGYETGIPDVADPLGGSFYLERLTDELEKKGWEYIQEIDKRGGAVAAIEQQYYQQEIASSAYRYQQEIETKEKIIVGVNEFVSGPSPEHPSLVVDDSLREVQRKRIEALKHKRDSSAVKESLSALRLAARGEDNLLPPILACVECYATLGEIANTLREVWGEY